MPETKHPMNMRSYLLAREFRRAVAHARVSPRVFLDPVAVEEHTEATQDSLVAPLVPRAGLPFAASVRSAAISVAARFWDAERQVSPESVHAVG